MKHCLEKLKLLVPLSGDATRHTTLGLLINATATINVRPISSTYKHWSLAYVF